VIKIIAIGKNNDKNLGALLADYQQRIAHFHKLEIVEIPERGSTKETALTIDQQSQEILKRIKESEYVILLDLSGEMLDSLTFAGKLETWLSTQANLCFIIGGSQGVNAALKKRADCKWCLAKVTFPHLLVRLLLLEQIYRAFKINAHQSYHK